MVSQDALRTTGHSGQVIRDIFDMHFKSTDPITVLDLTFGNGTFWKWDWAARQIDRTTNDMMRDTALHSEDFHATHWEAQSFDIVLYDPPFKAGGKPSKGPRDSDRYGSTRDQRGAPRTVAEVREQALLGLYEARRLARFGIVAKVQAVTESNRVAWNDELFAWHFGAHKPYGSIEIGEWFLDDKVWSRGARRRQTHASRGIEPMRFQYRPSVFFVAKRKGERL